MSLRVRTLGAVELHQNGEQVDLGSPRQRALLARLLIGRGAVVSTDRLVHDLWAGDPPDSARHTLHVYISRLRKLLGSDADRLQSRAGGYCFLLEPHELDAALFESLADEGRAALARNDAEHARTKLTEALSLWRGAALADFDDEEFARQEAIRLNELRLATHEQWIWAELEAGEHRAVVEVLQTLVGQHPLRETLWEQLMLALYRSGRQAEALRAFQQARTILAEELGIEPGPALQEMEDRIVSHDPSLQGLGSGETAGPPPRLPLQRTSFVGRQQELAIGAELLSHARLLTLTGPPGSGKTRLALRLAEDHAARYAHGVAFVSLAALTSHRHVDRSIAQVLELREVTGESTLDGIKAYLKDRSMLVVIDNFEHVLPAASVLGQVLDVAPGVTILVTSRSPLGIAGEQEFPVPPLRVPPPRPDPNPDELVAYDAIALFVARARTVDPGFALTVENAASIAAITARLDGLPLAIELAAARIRLLPPADLRRRLDERLTLLLSGPSDSPDRHRTMRDAIAWSYGLLEPAEQALFRRLAVFQGGFTVEAARAVADLTDEEALDGIEVLMTHSLLHRPVDVGRARFSMLAMIREFALEQLVEADELDAMCRRHADFFLDLAAEIEPQLSQDPGGEGAARLAADNDNLRAVLGYAIESDQPDMGLQLGARIWRFWQSSDLLTEGREWLVRLLELPGALPGARADGVSALAGLSYWLADYDRTLELYDEALAIYRTLGDRRKEAETLYGMSFTAGWRDELDYAEKLADAALTVFDELGDPEGVARSLIAKAFVVWKRSDLTRAKEIWEQSLDIVQAAGNEALANTALVGLASLMFQLGDRPGAMRTVMEGMEVAAASNAHITVWMLDFVAAFAAEIVPDRAVRLAGAVESFRAEAGGGILPESLGVPSARTIAAGLLEPVDLETEWEAGHHMSREEAVHEARVVAAIANTPTR